jgi:formate dehydrogenase iron-sulfur subunit
MSKAILYDATLCIGCKQCERACAEKNKLPYDDKIAEEAQQSEHKFTVVMTKDDKFMRRLCMHCEDPACASVCPVSALMKTEAGPVIYDAHKCMGCRYCMLACAFQVPKYEWNSLNPRVRKCIMCPDWVSNGWPTACAQACPTGATKFGDRDDLLAEAAKRISDTPANYVPYIYGKDEVGGTSVLLISSVPVAEFGYPTGARMVDKPLPGYTYAVLKHIPDYLPLAVVGLGGIYWITNRRAEVAAVEGKGKKNDGGAK